MAQHLDSKTPGNQDLKNEEEEGAMDQQQLELQSFIDKYKLHKIESALFEEEITIKFLMSQTTEEINEIAKELTNSKIQQNKFKFAVSEISNIYKNKNKNDEVNYTDFITIIHDITSPITDDDENDDKNSDENDLEIFVRLLNSCQIILKMKPSDTIEKVKQNVAKILRLKPTAMVDKICYVGRLVAIDSDRTLQECHDIKILIAVITKNDIKLKHNQFIIEIANFTLKISSKITVKQLKMFMADQTAHNMKEQVMIKFNEDKNLIILDDSICLNKSCTIFYGKTLNVVNQIFVVPYDYFWQNKQVITLKKTHYDTTENLKKTIEKMEGVQPYKQIIKCNGQKTIISCGQQIKLTKVPMEDTKTLQQYNIQPNDILLLCLRPASHIWK
eukprot:440835_1